MTPKVFFVTGTARGLGKQVAEAILAAGHSLVATARNPEQIRTLRETYGSRVITASLDVTDADAAQAAVETAIGAFGRIDVLINNAGYANLASVEDITLEDFRAQVDTNLFGVVTVTKAVLPVMRQQGSGHIIQVSSLGGRVATAGLAAYQSAKWAVGGFSEVLAQEVAPLGIKVTVLEPGGMRTDWAGSSMAIPPISVPYRHTVGALAHLLKSGANAAAGDPAKVARLIVRLADLDSPPLRLLVGSDAITYAASAAKALAENDQRWESLSRSTDHDSVDARSVDPLGQLS